MRFWLVMLLAFSSTAESADSLEETFQAPADAVYAAALNAIARQWKVVSTDAASRTVVFHVGRGFGRDPQDGVVTVAPTGEQSCKVAVTTQGGKGGSVWGAGGGKVRKQTLDLIHTSLASGSPQIPNQALVSQRSSITVAVRAASANTGFVEPKVADSIRDLLGKLREKSTLQVVDDPSSADVVVEIVSRGVEETGTSKTKTTSTLTSSWDGKPAVEQSSRSEQSTALFLRGRLVAGGYAVPMTGSHGALWTGAAGHLANQVEAWIAQNRSTLLARRNAPSTADPVKPSEPSGPMAAQVPAADPPGAFTIESTPPGAEVYVDGDFLGTTPMDQPLAPGKHQIELRKKGFSSWSRQLTVNAGARSKIVAELDPQ